GSLGSGAAGGAGQSVAERIQSTPAAARPGRRVGDEPQRPHISPVDVLLQRVVVVADGRADELVAGLAADGMTVRAVSPEAVATMIAGLVVVEQSAEASPALEALATLQRRGSAVGSLLLTENLTPGA